MFTVELSANQIIFSWKIKNVFISKFEVLENHLQIL